LFNKLLHSKAIFKVASFKYIRLLDNVQKVMERGALPFTIAILGWENTENLSSKYQNICIEFM
jgi:hypothetical protein